jgi:hypothetical protein
MADSGLLTTNDGSPYTKTLDKNSLHPIVPQYQWPDELPSSADNKASSQLRDFPGSVHPRTVCGLASIGIDPSGVEAPHCHEEWEVSKSDSEDAKLAWASLEAFQVTRISPDSDQVKFQWWGTRRPTSDDCSHGMSTILDPGTTRAFRKWQLSIFMTRPAIKHD